MAEKPFRFQGFGPLPSSDPTYMGGVGSGASFAPMVDSVPKSRIPRRGLLSTGGSSLFPFALIPQGVQLQVYYGSVDGTPPDGMVAGTPYLIDPCGGSAGTADVYVHVVFDATTNQISSQVIEFGASVPSNTAIDKYFWIGGVKFTTGSGYSVINQEISESIYTDPAYYISDGENTLFADQNSLNLSDSTNSSKIESNTWTLTNSETGFSVVITVPDGNVGWQTLTDPCSGLSMKVLGTTPA